MAAGRVDTYDQRAELLGSIRLRNRTIAVLRIVVPVIGVGALALMLGQIYLAGLARQYGVAGIRIDRGSIVVEAPQYSGTGSNGSRYLATAREARTPVLGGNDIDMTDATLELLQGDGITYFVSARTAKMNTATEVITSPGLVDVTGSDGLVGTLNDVNADPRSDLVVSKGAVDLLLPDGTTIAADNMVHDGKTSTFTFLNATVVVPDLPEAEEGAMSDVEGFEDVTDLDLREAIE